MRSYITVTLLAVIATLLAGSAYGRDFDSVRITRDVGEEFEAAVPTFPFEVQRCFMQTPHDEIIEFKPTDNSNDKIQLLEDTELVKCRAMVRNLDENDNGDWILTAEFTSGDKQALSYEVTVNAPESEASTTPKVEDNGEDNEVILENLEPEEFVTKIGNNHSVVIPKHDFITSESCFVQTPEGTNIDLETAVQIYDELEMIKDSEVVCGININVQSEAIVGQWTLISRGRRFGTGLERRLPFNIRIEETSHAIPSEIIIAEGNTFHVRLEKPTSAPESCQLLGPGGEKYQDYENDDRYVDTCGFIVRNVDASADGTWQIVYGNRIVYRANVQVTVIKNGGDAEHLNFTWTRDRPVQEIFGPVDAIYCKVVDPLDFVVFEGFGRCNVTLPAAPIHSHGEWKMFLGLEGHVLTQESTFTVNIVEPSPKPLVVTEVIEDKPTVSLTCSVTTPYAINTCKFRTPDGRILMANPGVGEDRYTFAGTGSNFDEETGLFNHECGIKITTPQERDLGFWRCGVETSDEEYYGFMLVLIPWLLRDPEIAAAVSTEPTLTADKRSFEAFEGDSVLLSCSVQAAIRYCYFRSPNGTIFNVGPEGSSSDMAVYSGAGLDAGECGARFRTLRTNDTGDWTCHVGFQNTSWTEQDRHFSTVIRAPMEVTQSVRPDGIRIETNVTGRVLEYCRYVRSDGFGFSSDAIPSDLQDRYVAEDDMEAGMCRLMIVRPMRVDTQPWLVVTRIVGQGVEMSATALQTTQGPPEDRPVAIIIYRIPFLWVSLMFLGLSLIMTAALMSPKKNRQWAAERASRIRNSFRNSFAKKAVNEPNVANRNTANAA